MYQSIDKTRTAKRRQKKTLSKAKTEHRALCRVIVGKHEADTENEDNNKKTLQRQISSVSFELMLMLLLLIFFFVFLLYTISNHH